MEGALKNYHEESESERESELIHTSFNVCMRVNMVLRGADDLSLPSRSSVAVFRVHDFVTRSKHLKTASVVGKMHSQM